MARTREGKLREQRAHEALVARNRAERKRQQDVTNKQNFDAAHRKSVAEAAAKQRAFESLLDAYKAGHAWAVAELEALAGQRLNAKYAGARMADMDAYWKDVKALINKWLADRKAAPKAASPKARINVAEVYRDLNAMHYGEQELEQDRAAFNEKHGEDADQNIIAKPSDKARLDALAKHCYGDN